jgi:hypothetical protein
MATWKLDPVHSSVQFSARHMMVSNVRGKFRDFSVDVDFDPEHPEQGGSQPPPRPRASTPRWTRATSTFAPRTS